ncbi:MAG: ABC transporter permease [Chloroflexota bacterium]|nr:ABC transporter permease [Chloroflexota bacterium]
MDIFQKFYHYFENGFIYIFDRWERVSPRFSEHLQMVGLSLGIALLIALPLGFLISRVRWLSAPVLGVLGVLYTIPSLAFLAFFVPVYGLGFTTTVIVLVIYAQTMLVRNIALGFTGIDRSILEAARGMGMSSSQVFWQVELPLATPVIVAGIRITTLSIISIATVGAWVGAGGLGQLLRVDNPRLNAAGIICVILIALVADQLYRVLELVTGGYRHRQAVDLRINPY